MHQLVAMIGLVLSTAAAAQLFGSSQDFEKFSAADVVLNYPEDWRQLPLPPPTVVAFTRGNDASFSITRTAVDFPPSYNEAFVDYEVQSLRRQNPDATDFVAVGVKHRTLGEILQVDFTRPPAKTGRNNRAMRHRFFAVPAGNYIYRVYCVARADEFVRRYEPLFNRIIDSLVITPPQVKTGL
jgi:hypothetical protein